MNRIFPFLIAVFLSGFTNDAYGSDEENDSYDKGRFSRAPYSSPPINEEGDDDSPENKTTAREAETQRLISEVKAKSKFKGKGHSGSSLTASPNYGTSDAHHNNQAMALPSTLENLILPASLVDGEQITAQVSLSPVAASRGDGDGLVIVSLDETQEADQASAAGINNNSNNNNNNKNTDTVPRLINHRNGVPLGFSPLRMCDYGFTIDHPAEPYDVEGQGRELQQQCYGRLYPLPEWEGFQMDKFANRVDQELFWERGFLSAEPSKKVKLLMMFGMAMAGAITQSAIGYTNSALGTALNLEKDGLGTTGVGVWINATFLLPLMREMAIAGRDVGTYLLNEGILSPADVDAEGNIRREDELPHIIKESSIHRKRRIWVALAAAAKATITPILMFEVEKGSSFTFASIAFPFYFLTMFRFYYEEGCNNLHRGMLSTYDRTADDQDNRQQLLEVIRRFKAGIKKKEAMVNEVYRQITAAKKAGFPTRPSDPFLASLFCCGSYVGRSVVSSASSPAQQAQNEGINRTSDRGERADRWQARLLTTLNIGIASVSAATRFGVYQWGLETAFTNLFQANATVATAASWLIAGFDTVENVIKPALAASVTTDSTWHDYFQRWVDCLEAPHLTNFTLLRRLSGLISLVNSALFSLPNAVAGLNYAFYNASPSMKIVGLFALFWADLMENDRRLNKMGNDLITQIFCIRQDTIDEEWFLTRWEPIRKAWLLRKWSLERKKAVLDKYADRWADLILRYDPLTIRRLYDLIVQQKDSRPDY